MEQIVKVETDDIFRTVENVVDEKLTADPTESISRDVPVAVHVAAFLTKNA